MALPPHMTSEEVDEYLDAKFVFTQFKMQDGATKYSCRPRGNPALGNTARLLVSMLVQHYNQDLLEDKDGYVNWRSTTSDAMVWKPSEPDVETIVEMLEQAG